MSKKESIKISSSTLQSIESISEPLGDLVQKYRATMQVSKIPTVAAFGLLKAGKSTFLNALTDDFENSRFAHGAVRTTIKNQFFYHNGINILDTPGVDANDQDTSIALDGLNSTDVFLFIHNPLCGELDRQEVELLQSLFKFYPNPTLVIENMICILTHKASLHDTDQATSLIQKIQNQFNEYFGLSPQICLVESPSYFKARKENKQILLKKSGIESVLELISEKLPNIAKAKDAKIDRLKKEIKKLLIEEKLNVKKEIEHAENVMNSIINEVQILRSKIASF